VGAQLWSAFNDIGVTLDLEALPASTYTDALFHGERPMFFQSFGADSPDPAYAVGVLYQSNRSNNWSGYKSAGTDACLASAGRPQLAGASGSRSTSGAQRSLLTTPPGSGLPQPGFQVGTRRDVTGINWYAGEAVDWSKVGYTS
jgi:hypothetical protein